MIRSVLKSALAAGMVAAAASGFAEGAKAPRVLVLATSVSQFPSGKATGLWLEEFAVPYKLMTEAGISVTVASPKGGAVPVDPASKAKTPEQEAQWAPALAALASSQALSAATIDSGYDAVFIPGGHGPLYDLASDAQAARLISDFARDGKIVASVCHGPAALVGAVLANGTPFVKGKRLTSFSDEEENGSSRQAELPFSVERKLSSLGAAYSMGGKGAVYTVEDGNLITGQNPRSSAALGALLVKKLGK